MRHIDFRNKTPMDKGILNWKPWSKEKWEKWLKTSNDLHEEAALLDEKRIELETAGDSEGAKKKRDERNEFISKNSAHWGKLKPWLFALSHGKCWFTDTTNDGSHYDVEHFRPKAEAKSSDGTERDGYWWLAFDYTNYRLAGGVPNAKKGGWFPLCEGTRCSTVQARCEESEVPYLLDPISRTDHLLLAFDEEGNAIPVPSASNWATDLDKWNKTRAEESIKRYKLNEHDALPSKRRETWIKVNEAIKEYTDAKNRYHPTNNPMPVETMEQAARRIEELTKPEVQFASVAKWCVLLRNIPELSRLVY